MKFILLLERFSKVLFEIHHFNIEATHTLHAGQMWLLRSIFYQYNVYKWHDIFQVWTNTCIHVYRSQGQKNNLSTCMHG